MKYLMLIQHSENIRNQQIPQGLMDAMGKFVTEQLQKGTIKETAGLKPSKDGFRIASKGGKLHTIDGPFAESKELVGGYAIGEFCSEKEARAMAHEFMELHRIHWPAFEGTCEVRPLEEM
ncbi:MAG TPA: YciI family protein [Gemmatimonadales bacterium]|nr:YciI family protein [Gemmatimonadales bacterium]